MKPSWGRLGRLEAVLGPSWGRLAPSLGVPRGPVGALGLKCILKTNTKQGCVWVVVEFCLSCVWVVVELRTSCDYIVPTPLDWAKNGTPTHSDWARETPTGTVANTNIFFYLFTVKDHCSFALVVLDRVS